MLKDFYTSLNFLDKKQVPDSLGGYKWEWVLGSEFSGMLERASTQQQILATQNKLNEVYVLMCDDDIDLNVDDYVAGKERYFRVTSEELKPPKKSRLKVSQYILEMVVLNNE